MRRSIVAITAVTEPISIACALARSPRSAKNSMKAKMISEIRISTNQSGPGITPTAPWIRSLRASSRSAVWSSHWSYADCSAFDSGDVVLRVRKRAAAQGLIVSPWVPASSAGHSS